MAQDAAKQLEAAIQFILGHQDLQKLSLISHSWGSMPASLFAATRSGMVDRLVLFAPIGRREPRCYEAAASLPACRIITPEDQWNRSIEDVPAHEPSVLSRVHFDEWSTRYLDSDPESRSRDPARVKKRLACSARSSRRGTASLPTIRTKSAHRSRSFEANGMD